MPLTSRQRLALQRLFPSHHTQALTDPQLDRLAQLWTVAALRRVRAAWRQSVHVLSPVWPFQYVPVGHKSFDHTEAYHASLVSLDVPR